MGSPICILKPVKKPQRWQGVAGYIGGFEIQSYLAHLILQFRSLFLYNSEIFYAFTQDILRSL